LISRVHFAIIPDMTKTTPVDRLLLRPAEVAETLGVCRSKAYDLIARGVIPSVRIGWAVRVPAGHLKRWIEEQATTGQGAER
jgi:excisionase family DNA binding protein